MHFFSGACFAHLGDGVVASLLSYSMQTLFGIEVRTSRQAKESGGVHDLSCSRRPLDQDLKQSVAILKRPKICLMASRAGVLLLGALRETGQLKL